jgi:predicted nuclease of predicted toxin-antitoxin system
VKAIFDHNLSPRLARSLQALMGDRYEIVALRDKYPVDIKDIDLINRLSLEGTWVFVSGDRRITRNKAEKAVFRSSKLIGMFLSSGLYKAPVRKQAERLIGLWETIETVSKSVSGGAMFEIPMKSQKLGTIRD